MSTGFFYILFTVYHYLTPYSLCTNFQYLALYSLLCSVSLYPLLSSTVCPLSVSTSHFTVCWFCATMSTAVFYSMSTVCQYLTLYSRLCSVSLYPLLSSTVCPLSVITSHFTVCWFCATMSTAVFYSMSTVCQYLTLYSLLCSVSLYPLLSSTVCPLSVITSHFSVCWFCATMSTVVFYSLSTLCHYLALYSLLVLCHYVHCCLLQSVRCLSVPHTLQSVGSVSLCPLLSSTVCPLSVSTSHSIC